MDTLKLVNGRFDKLQAERLITNLVDVKIEFHKAKIDGLQNEEDIKNSERRIIELQNYRNELLKNVRSSNGMIDISADISLKM